MKLFIRVIDGSPFEHPVTEETMFLAFPDVDLNNLPPAWAEFVRAQKPAIGVYQKYVNQDAVYEVVNGKYTDVWHITDMTAEEKAAKQQAEKDAWAADPVSTELTGWVFSDELCLYVAPIPRPSDDVTKSKYFWQGTTLSWVERPQYPSDGREYRLDRPTATWVPIN